MGTRGIYGFYKNGVDKITLNAYDSDPLWLGKNIIKFVKTTSIREMNEIFDKIILIDENIPATNEQIKECREYYKNLNNHCKCVDQKEEIRRWNWVLYKARGKLESYKNDLKYMIDSKEFIKCSLYCEWGYIMNLDTNKLEIYKGFQKSPQMNRYYTEETCDMDNMFYNCALIEEFDLENIPGNWEDKLLGIEEIG